MLSLLHIENIAVIEQAEILFEGGFNVLTGETGAGKSIVIDAISAILGERTYRDVIRTGASRAFVSAIFTKIPECSWFSENQVEFDPLELQVQREIYADGKNVCRVNGRPVSVAALKKLGARLINIHGQHDSQQLFDEENHLTYLDAFARDEKELEDYRAAFDALQSVRREIQKLSMDESEKLRLVETLKFQIDEIERAALHPGEDEELEARRKVLQNAEKITGALQSAMAALYGDESSSGAAELLAGAEQALSRVERVDESIGALHGKISDLMYAAQDAAEELRDTLDGLSYSAEELEEIESRLDTIHRLKRKYGASCEEILQFLENAKTQLDEIEFASDRIERLESLGMVWDTGSILWEKNYAAAVQYHLEHDDLEIPVKYVTPDGMALGVWLGSQRAAYKEGVLTDAQIEKLEALGVDWTNRNDRKWQTAYEAAVKYHAAHGNLDVPTEYIDEDGILLGKWVSRQRYAWQNPERSSARVTPERKALLDELGMNWEKTDSWQHRYELAVEYKKEHGSLAVPAQYRTEDGIWLGSWLSRQKQMLREGKKLSAGRRAALKELFKGEKGRRLSAPVPPACSVREQNWLDNYQSARLYAEKKGSLLVPAGYVDENGFRLGVWISNLRAARKARPGSFQVTPEHIALLDAIGMQWDAREAKWAGAFRRAEEYRAAHGDLLVPVNYKTEDGFCLGDWVRRMRENYACAEKKLTAERIAKLEALGMVWTVPQEG